MNTLQQHLQRSPIIAGVKSVESAKKAMALNIGIIFYLAGTIFDLMEVTKERKADGPLIFAHVDLLQGVGKDASGLQFLSQEIGVDGILTTRSHLTRQAKKEGLLAIQRIFALDSEALKTGFSVLRAAKPDAVEILPALILPHIRDRIPVDDLPPIIAGGLVETTDEVDLVIKPPVHALSTSREELWRTYSGGKNSGKGSLR